MIVFASENSGSMIMRCNIEMSFSVLRFFAIESLFCRVSRLMVLFISLFFIKYMLYGVFYLPYLFNSIRRAFIRRDALNVSLHYKVVKTDMPYEFHAAKAFFYKSDIFIPS